MQHFLHLSSDTILPIFTTWRYASTVYAVVVCSTICPSQAGTVPKWLNVGSCKQSHAIVQGLSFPDAEDFAKFQQGNPQQGWQIEVG